MKRVGDGAASASGSSWDGVSVDVVPVSVSEGGSYMDRSAGAGGKV